MSGINTGILTNAYPLSSEQISALEKKALETNEAFVYLDEQSNICFTGAVSPEIIKELAWYNVHELKAEADLLTKTIYKKQAQKTFCLEEILQKNSINDEWLSMYITTGLLDESLLDEFSLE